MKTRIETRFEELRKTNSKGFIAYITAGDPTLIDTEDLVLRLEDVGVDIVELGVPFSDPLADGRINQESATRALNAGATYEGILQCVSRIRKKSDIPLMFYSYLNLLLARGFDHTIKITARAGLDGLLILDLPVEEDGEYLTSIRKHHMNNICLVTPTSPERRIRRIVARSSGFVYCVSREGVTGIQRQLGNSAVSLVRRTKRLTSLPVALGFGISTPAQARAAAEASDAVVVGSAIVQKFADAGRNKRARTEAARWVGKLVNAVKKV